MAPKILFEKIKYCFIFCSNAKYCWSTKVLVPSLQIKLRLMKAFVKGLPKNGECYNIGPMCNQFRGLSEARFKIGIFVES